MPDEVAYKDLRFGERFIIADPESTNQPQVLVKAPIFVNSGRVKLHGGGIEVELTLDTPVIRVDQPPAA